MSVEPTWWIIIGLVSLLVEMLFFIMRLSKTLAGERFRNRSQSTRYGKLTEQFLPLVETYPWEANKFRFLGSPIDGIQFADDRIILVEFKTGGSRLSKNQRHIRDLVNGGEVYFEVIRVA